MENEYNREGCQEPKGILEFRKPKEMPIPIFVERRKMQYLRKGRFYVTEENLKSNRFAEILGKMKFVPWGVSFLVTKKAYEYIGTSILFDELESLSLIPEYKITIRKLGDCDISVTAKKV